MVSVSVPASFKTFCCVALIASLMAGCADEPITENGGAKIPAFYAAHHSGIVETPTDADVALAVKFGLHAKDHADAVQSAYLSRNELTGASLEVFHIVVRTPLYLISRDALEQDADGKGPDPAFNAYARNLACVQLSLSRTNITSETWRDYVLDRELILFRDGVRVEPLSSIPAWKDGDPFDDPNDPLSSWQSDTWLKHGVEEMQEGQLRATEEGAADKKDRRRAGRLHAGWIALEPGDAVFSVTELRKPGRYEVVFRKLPGSNSASAAAREIRLPIVFDGFR